MTTEAHTLETAPAPRPTAGSRRTAVVAIVVVALAAGGAALAASKFNGSSSSASAGGPGGGFAPGSQAQGGFGPPGGGFRDRDRGPRGFGGLSAAADYLGISTSTLFSDLQSGKTLAQVAQATSGKSVQGLIDAMVAAEKTQLKSAVSSGRLTQAQADQLGSEIESRVADLVNGGFRGPGGSAPPQSRAVPGVTL